jgi:HlyD family secretion protein
VLTSPPTQDQLNQAQAAVDAAQQAYQLAQKPYTAQDLAQAQAAVDAAQAQVNAAAHPGSAADIAAAQGAVQSAAAQVQLAEQPASSADLAKAQSAVDVAAQQLKLAQQPYTTQDKDAAQAALQQAQAALQAAKVADADAIVTAPFDGVISQKLLAVGAMAAPTTPIAVLIDPNVDVVLGVDPAQASALHIGDAATITADALPGKTIPGKVATIAPSADPQTRTVQVKVAPNDQSAGLVDGTIAQVRLVTATHHGVVVVPTGAIVQYNGNPTVYVVANGVASPRAIQTGLSDGKNTEVTSGLKVGETIVVSGQDHLNGSTPVSAQ